MRGWKPWTVQPPAGTPIDWDSPLAAHLVFAYNGATPAPQNADSLGLRAGTALGTAYGQGVTAVGLSTEWGGAGSVVFPRDASLEPTTVTVAAYCMRTATLSAQSAIIVKAYTNSTISVSYGLFLDFLANGQNYAGFLVYDGTNPNARGNVPNSAAPTLLIGTAGAAGINLYAGEVLVSHNTTVPVLTYDTTTTGDLILSGVSSAAATSPFTGNIFSAFVWGRQFDTGSIELFAANPWQLFYKRRRAYGFVASSTISASISESAASADAYGISATATAALSAAATADATYALAATVPSAISEAISPSDVYALAVAVAAALDSSAAASSALSAVATIASTIAEVADAKDTLCVTATILAAIAEAATATDTQATGSVTSAAYAESATAAAIFTATVSIAATLTEAGLAADQIAAMATVAADLAESGAASDAYLRSVLLAVELLENAAAADELSASALEQIIDAAKTIITIVQARDTVNIVQAQDTLRILQ